MKDNYRAIDELPHDRDTERVVLATLMRYNDKANEYASVLHDGLFYYDLEKALYRAIVGVIREGQKTDVNSICGYVNGHDVGYQVDRGDVVDLVKLPSAGTLLQDIDRLKKMARRRELWTVLQDTAKKVVDPFADIDVVINKAIEEITDRSEADGDAVRFADALDELDEVVKGNSEGRQLSLMTGYPLFDKYYLLRPGTLTVIAAFTSVGKTAFALNIAKAVASSGCPVAYYSMEMGKAELAARIVAEDAEIPASMILNKKLDGMMMRAYEDAAKRYRNLQLFIDERNKATFESTMGGIRQLAKTKGVKLVVIDYLQIYTQTTDNVEAALGSMARMAKNIAMETQTAVMVLSQLNRSEDHPSIKMLRGSGQIEESADNIVLIDRPDAYPDNKVKKYVGEFSELPDIKGTAKLILAKGRGVGTAAKLVRFNGEFTKFIPMYEGSGEEQTGNDLPF